MIAIQNEGSIIRITLPESFEVQSVADFRTKVLNLLAEGTESYIIDFSRCQFIDSTGLGVLVSVYKRCVEKGVSLSLSSINHPKVATIFNLTRLDKVFTILPK